MRSALSRTPEMSCGRKPPPETWLPSPAPLMLQVQTQRESRHALSVLLVRVILFIIPHYVNYKFVFSLVHRSDFAPVHSGRCRSRLLGEPDSHQVCLQELREHSDDGTPHIWTLIQIGCVLTHSVFPSQTSECQRFRLTS